MTRADLETQFNEAVAACRGEQEVMEMIYKAMIYAVYAEHNANKTAGHLREMFNSLFGKDIVDRTMYHYHPNLRPQNGIHPTVVPSADSTQSV